MKPLVSACIITYNQQDYIAEAIKGALMQELDEPYEIVVSDDCSTDDTPKIIRELAKSDPRIRVIERSKNLGMHLNWLEAINACSGEFIALCEGDDYWTDNRKLSKQLAVFQNDASVSCCFSDSSLLAEKSVNLRFNSYLQENEVDLTRTRFGINELSVSNFIPTCTVMFRKDGMLQLPDEYFQSPYADWFVHLHNAIKGDFYLILEKTASYRLHENGAFGQIPQRDRDNVNLKCLSLLYEGYGNQTAISEALKQSLTDSIKQKSYTFQSDGHYLRFLMLALIGKMHDLTEFTTFARLAVRL
ncbi:glycosyltransferase [Flavobacteriales bacterium]|nr:glycosyltransferase [Flavobacteriales bacterium]